MGSDAEAAMGASEERADLLRRFLVLPSEPGTPEERAARARQALGRLHAGVRVTKAMYRPGRSRSTSVGPCGHMAEAHMPTPGSSGDVER